MKDQVQLLLDLRGMRREAGMPLAEVVKLSGVCKSNYERLQNGATPSLDNALKLARFLRMPVEEIWKLKEREQPSHGRGAAGHTRSGSGAPAQRSGGKR
jgi:DNA-binding XRE family transcriptional regulator